VRSTSARRTAQVDGSAAVGSEMRGSGAQCVCAVQSSAGQLGEADSGVMRRHQVADTAAGNRLLLASSDDVTSFGIVTDEITPFGG
jgi:hypothetical protein